MGQIIVTDHCLYRFRERTQAAEDEATVYRSIQNAVKNGTKFEKTGKFRKILADNLVFVCECGQNWLKALTVLTVQQAARRTVCHQLKNLFKGDTPLPPKTR